MGSRARLTKSHAKKATVKRKEFHIFSKFLKEENNNVAVYIDESIDYGPICPHIHIPLDAASITIDLSLDLLSHDVSKDLPSLVFQSEQFYNTSLRFVDDLNNSLNTGNWEHFYAKASIPISDEMRDAELKVFLYNSQHTVMEYDNLKMNVNYEQK